MINMQMTRSFPSAPQSGNLGARATMSMKPLQSPLLAVGGLTCAYGSLVALSDASLQVGRGECVCIVGPNGAGKTTLLSNIAGLYRPQAGSIVFDGNEIAGLGPERISRLGVSMVPEGRRIFGTLSVAEN